MKDRKSVTRDAQTRALGLLARREHSRRELRRKLVRSGHEEDEVQATLTRLDGSGLQSDQRFAEILVRSRIAQGHGPVRIAAELRLHGLDEALVDKAFAAAEPDWEALALELYRRRFRTPAEDQPERIRRARFLVTRGFTPAMARTCLDLDPSESDDAGDLD
ncbi:regulatory protein RecX [Pseudofulvimonas gallinarii]|jgi:regulatory protein|uniref:Regulatory protein RecX n=1 Tax=Pseudofulvimonas gallinarii TaxID=634155 RepID=A0A4R3LGJ1_9GAMM|nr:regulatory protein RecX [Pseudofulvimonas gallinarii]TCS98565.1 regulatory protein [Pseudofulvimonas gallinarii]